MNRAIRILAAASFVTAVSTSAQQATVAPTVSGTPQIGRFGFDEAGMDRAVAPGDSFFGYADGGWVRATTIPPDRASFGMFHVLDDLSRARTRTILDAASRQPGSKIGDFYASVLDESAANARGLGPIAPWLAAIRGAGSKAALATEMGRLLRLGVSAPFAFYVDQDDKAPDSYIVKAVQSGLGLPDRDYFLKDDPKLAATRTAYLAYLAKLLTLAGEQDAATRAAAVFPAFEKQLATVQWSQVDSRDADKTYNKWTRADFNRLAPGFDWAGFLGAAGVGDRPAFIVAQPSAFAGSATAIAATPLAVLQDYAALRLLDQYAPYLSRPLVDAEFAFNGTVLAGTPENKARWKRGVDVVTAAMGEAIGKEYVARYFPPEAKAAADALVRNVVAAMATRLRQLGWMAPATKRLALAKLAAFHPKIGYPDRWRDYSRLVIRRDDLVGNVARAVAFEWQRNLDKLGGPIDRGEWQMTPMEINAYANFGMNEIVFPAAILQPPFFDPHADPAINYGGIGAVIGHELSHHFDDQGRKYDSTGRLTDWWTPGRRRALHRADRPAGAAIRRLRADPRPACPGRADAGREHRRPRRVDGGI